MQTAHTFCNNNMDAEFLLDTYDYYLPSERIAQFPPDKRGNSRLLYMRPNLPGHFQLEDALFANIHKYLPPNALLVANNARVIPCRISLTGPGGGKGEFLLLTPLPEIMQKTKRYSDLQKACVECLLRPGNRFHVGSTYEICPQLEISILEKLDYGRHQVELTWQGNLEDILIANGKLPLPPYIHRQATHEDKTRYQTCYASKNGAIAAPTAGLHFTSELREKLSQQGIEWREITLYVGYGTFSPIRCADIRDHEMHSELMEIDEQTAMAINRARTAGRPVIAIGTTSLRALESASNMDGIIQPGKKWTNIYIYPGFHFRITDGLITNFHLPKSSLLLLVAAFAGRENILRAYEHALAEGYNFFSYGDAMYIKKATQTSSER